MNEPIKKPNQVPESYSLKKTEILNMAEDAANKSYRDISQLEPFQKNFEIFLLPPSIVIGKEISVPCHGKKPISPHTFWKNTIPTEDWKNAKRLPHVIKNTSCGWTCDYVPQTDSFTYIISIVAPAGTPVPSGFIYRNVPQTTVAVGLWGDSLNKVIGRMKKLGFVTSWYDDPGLGWNTELYLADEQSNENVDLSGKPKVGRCRWMVPCKKEDAK
jgi:hypothetical protein